MQETIPVASSTGSSHAVALSSTPATENVWSFDLDLTTPFDPVAIKSASRSASTPETYPPGMSEARRKARAELVREAFDCGNY